VLLVLALGAYLVWRHWAAAPQTAEEAPATGVGAEVVVEHGQLYGGIPRLLDGTCEVLRNQAYVVGYSEERRDPVWVGYHLPATTNHVSPPRPRGFLPDPRTTAHVTTHDYSRAGYDRGHMCPNHAIAIHFGAAAQEETFLMSNVVPQLHTLNAGLWEQLEQQESDVYPNRFGEVWVLDGPVFHDPVRQLDSGVAIPEACYKIIVRLDRGRPHVLPVLMPQNVGHDRMIDHYLTSVKQIEAQTHLIFFTALPENQRRALEQEQPAAPW